MSRRSQESSKSVPQVLYFKEVLQSVGVSLQTSENPNVFLKEQSLIIRDLQEELEQHPNYPRNIETFITGLKHFVKTTDCFKKALYPSQFQRATGDIDDNVTYVELDSVFRVFLNVDCLQSEIISLILEEITTHAVAEVEDTMWLKLLLSSLRYLSYIKDAKHLTSNLLEILEVATHLSQIEILHFLPEVIPDSEHDETAKNISKLLNNTRLTSAIIDSLNHLTLNKDTVVDIQDHILAILNSTSSLKTFPIIFSFLLINCKPTNLSNILLKIRSALESIIIVVNKDSESELVLTFETIGAITVKSKAIQEGWINIINHIRSSKDHKSVDIIILLMLHSTSANRQHVVETIIKKKCKNRQFKSTLLESTLQKYLVPQLLKQYIQSILKIGACLLQLQSDSSCFEFAKIIYTTTFGHKHADKQQRKYIIESLILLSSGSDGKGAIPALNTLSAIAGTHLKLLEPHTMQLMTLLDKLQVANLNEVKLIFDLLCGLTCGPQAHESLEIFQSNIYMIVRKQLSSTNKSINYCGIIAAVATAKNIATVIGDQGDYSEDSYTSISELPIGPAKQAASILTHVFNLANTCTVSYPVSMGLYYDQLSQMVVTTDNLDKHFLHWLLNNINNTFQESYITEHPPEPIDDFIISEQYKLTTNEKIDTVIFINIAEMTIKSKENNNAMLIFAPLFRLLRLIIHVLHEGTLNTILALLCAGIAMPDIDPDVGVDNLGFEQSRQIVHCLFHCINWCREIVSAFVTQKAKLVKKMVLQRINNLVELESLFLKCVKSVPDPKLPQSYFYNINLDTTTNGSCLDRTKSSERTKKRTANTNSTTRITQTSQVATTSKPGRKQQGKDKDVGDFQFREMDTDIIILLKYPLHTGNSVPATSLHITLSQYKFIVNDLVMKLTKITKSNSPTAFTHLVTVKSEHLIPDCVGLMTNISKHLMLIIDETKTLLEKTDGIHDAHDMFMEPATELKICFNLTLETLSLIFNWSEFQNNKHLPLLRELLRALVDEESSQLNSAQGLIIEYLKCVMVFTDYCLTLPCAVHLVNIVKALCNITNDPTPRKKLVLLSGKLLSRKWFNLYGLPESGAVANVHIDNLVKAHLKGSNIETIREIVSWIHIESTELKKKDDHLQTFPCITKSNFPILYRGACATLLEALRADLAGSTNIEHLEIWQTIVTIMRELMAIIKVQESRANLSAFFNKSLAILKLFLSQGLPILEIMLRSHSDEVLEILRSLQQTTRFIHKLCCQSKVSKDNALNVPQMQLTLETMVYRVKAALTANNCSSAFWMGNLRNKNLRGEDIEQDSVTSSQNEVDNDEEELPPDDDSDNETVVSTSTSDKSVSVII